MSLAKHKTALGFFSLLALGLLLFGIIALGGGKLFKHDTQFVLYFGSSVSGLSVGAPVVFRGVPLGSVTHISLVANANKSNVTIPVNISIDAANLSWRQVIPCRTRRRKWPSFRTWSARACADASSSPASSPASTA